jgi:predicted alpha/beta hydrolase
MLPRAEGIAVEPVEITCADGWRLRADFLLPPSPRAVAVVSHAMMVDRRTLDRPRGRGLVSHLAGRGIAVLWADLRGHGQSGPRAEAGGRWSYDDLVEGDVPALIGAARARLPGLPIFAVGHSLFGHLTIAHLGRHPELRLDGVVMLACNIVHPEWRARWQARLVTRGLIEVMGLFVRASGRLPVRAVSFGSDDEAAPYVEDFVRMARQMAWQARDGFDYAAARPRVTVPVLALAAAGDRVMAPTEETRSLVAPLGGPTTFEVVGRRSGLPLDPGHMGIVLDERCRPAWDRVADWILGR